VTRLEAVDADIGLNSDVLYDIVSGNDDHAFTVDPLSGIVTVGQGGALSRRPSRVHRVVVVARDSGSPPLQAVADLTIAVNDSAVLALLGRGIPESHGGGLDARFAVAGGAAVGGFLVIGLILLVAIVVCCVRRRRSKQRRRREELEKRRCSRYNVISRF